MPHMPATVVKNGYPVWHYSPGVITLIYQWTSWLHWIAFIPKKEKMFCSYGGRDSRYRFASLRLLFLPILPSVDLQCTSPPSWDPESTVFLPKKPLFVEYGVQQLSMLMNLLFSPCSPIILNPHEVSVTVHLRWLRQGSGWGEGIVGVLIQHPL